MWRCKYRIETTLEPREFRNVVAGTGKELVVLCDGATEVPKIGELNEGGKMAS